MRISDAKRFYSLEKIASEHSITLKKFYEKSLGMWMVVVYSDGVYELGVSIDCVSLLADLEDHVKKLIATGECNAR